MNEILFSRSMNVLMARLTIRGAVGKRSVSIDELRENALSTSDTQEIGFCDVRGK